MADTFLNNQEVTAEDLNNIAVDLGYADYSHFPEDPPQSAVSALNQITADLTSAGILQIGNKCAVSISDTTIVVQDGVCVFGNGAKKRIEGTLTVDFIEGGTNYVYLFNNVSGNVIQLVNSLTAPTSGDYVMLAEIDTDKTVRTTRTFSRAKIGTLGASAVEISRFTKLDTPIETSEYSEAHIVARVENIDLTKYSYAVMYCPTTSSSGTVTTAVYDLSKNEILFQHSGSDKLTHFGGNGWITSWYGTSDIKIIDGCLSYILDDDLSYEYNSNIDDMQVNFV